MSYYGNDIGSINGSATNVTLLYYENKGQVYLATHDGESQRLPFMYRSFISFSFGGEYILDFGIIRVTEGLRMQGNLYTDFEDLTELYDVLHGQFYWGTHLKPLVLDYVLSTDGMTQTQLDKFKAWFAPGKIRLLIRALHPNRGILARVEAPPSMNMLPFLGSLLKVINGSTYNIPTTLYKGDIKISFVCDDPLWYSLQNLLGKRYIVELTSSGLQVIRESTSGMGSDFDNANQFYEYRWTDANGNISSVMRDGDALKVILLDNIPAANMVKIYTKLFLGGNIRVYDTLYYDLVHNRTTVAALAGPSLDGTHPPYAAVTKSRVGVTYAPAVGTFSYLEDDSATGISLGGSSDNIAYLYYAGNAPSYPTLYFTFTPQLSSGTIPYIQYPLNKYCPDSNGKTYNTIIIESLLKHEFRFTTPGAWNGYNQALYWFHKLANILNLDNTYGSSWQDVKTYIRDNVTHNGARAWALSIVEEQINLSIVNDNNNTTWGMLTPNNLQTIFNKMKNFIYPASGICTSKFSINSKDGICVGYMKYSRGNSVEETIENVGDMVRSTYLFLLETNYPLSSTGTIVLWSDSNEEAKKCVHKIYSDLPDALITNFSIEYKNMYY